MLLRATRCCLSLLLLLFTQGGRTSSILPPPGCCWCVASWLWKHPPSAASSSVPPVHSSKMIHTCNQSTTAGSTHTRLTHHTAALQPVSHRHRWPSLMTITGTTHRLHC